MSNYRLCLGKCLHHLYVETCTMPYGIYDHPGIPVEFLQVLHPAQLRISITIRQALAYRAGKNHLGLRADLLKLRQDFFYKVHYAFPVDNIGTAKENHLLCICHVWFLYFHVLAYGDSFC